MTVWMKEGCTAVITGGASGLGLETARRFVSAGMNVAIADRDEAALATASRELSDRAGNSDRVMAVPCDVSRPDDLEALNSAVCEQFGAVHCLMNNAGIGRPVAAPWESREALEETLSTNLWGIINGCHAFIPSMLAHGEPGAVINTGSKQGITRPPGNYAYNLSKAGVLAYTESVAHAFVQQENCRLSAHLLVPGFVYTPMVEKFIPQKPPFAWTAEETIDFMLPCLENGDFYILCPDNESTRDIDEKRIRWGADDLIQNRPALSRWHPDHKDAFEKFMNS